MTTKKTPMSNHERAKKAAAASPWKRKPACLSSKASKAFAASTKKGPSDGK